MRKLLANRLSIVIHMACYREGTSGRALPNGVTTTGGSNAMTVDLCTSECQAAGYLLAGAEYSGECCKTASPFGIGYIA